MRATAFLAVFLLLSTTAYSLPDSSTRRSGDLCEMGHPFKYIYSFSYSKTLLLGEDADFNITFSLWGAQIKTNPYIVEVEAEPDGFEVSETRFRLTDDKMTLVVRPLTEKPTLTLKTTLTLNGDDIRHRGYAASYEDAFTLDSFNVAAQGSTSTAAQGTTTSTMSSVPDTTTVEVVFEESEPSPMPWYIVRAAGLLAYLFLSLSVAFGLLRKLSPKRFSALFRHHCDISSLALILAFVHMATTLLDQYMWNLKFADVFFFNFSSNTHTMISLGVLGFYLMAAVTFSSLSPKIIAALKRRRWHLLHVSSYCVYLFVVVHSFILGSDLGASELGDPLSILIYAIFWLLAFINFILFAVFLGIRRGKK